MKATGSETWPRTIRSTPAPISPITAVTLRAPKRSASTPPARTPIAAPTMNPVSAPFAVARGDRVHLDERRGRKDADADESGVEDDEEQEAKVRIGDRKK